MGRHRSREPRQWLRVGLATALAIELAGAGYVVVDRAQQGPSHVATQAPVRGAVTRPDESARAAAERLTAVRTLLDRRSKALLARNRAGFLATIDPTQKAFVKRQGALFSALTDVPLGSWRYEVDAKLEAPTDSAALQRYATEVWVPYVTLRYALRGFDPEPTLQRHFLTFVRRGERWLIGNDDDFADSAGLQTARDLWDFGPVVVARTARALVLGHPKRRGTLQQVAALAELAVPRVTAIWGTDWPRKVVVLVPDTQAELATIIGEGNDLSQIAAVAVAELGDSEGGFRPVGNRVIVNPSNFTQLSRLGRQVVMTHEVTHVATRPKSGPGAPTWLVEGFADYVGYLGTGVPVRIAARELRSEVRRNRVPTRLPADDEFDGTNKRLPQAYEGAWLAVQLIVERTDEKSLVRFYRAAGSGESGTPQAILDRAFRDVLHTSTASFTAAWRVYLRSQLG